MIKVEIKDYSEMMLDYIKKYLFNKHAEPSSEKTLCAISITAKELFLVRPSTHLWEIHTYSDENELSTLISDLVKKNNMKGWACSLLLQPDEYQLIVSDPLPVTEDEFQAAIRWKVKDLLRFPLNDIVIDHFAMPKMKNNVGKIMVVAAQASKLKNRCDLLHQCGLNIKYIDIPELALRNIAVNYEQEGKTHAFMYVQENYIQLLITCEKQIYVTRTLKFNLKTSDENALLAVVDRLASEIQRSFDYYQSLWEHSSPAYLIYSSTAPISSTAISQLSEKLRVSVQAMKVDIPSDLQARFLPAMGAALRETAVYPQEINLYRYLPKSAEFELTPVWVLGSYAVFFGLLLLVHLNSWRHKHKLENQYNQVYAAVTSEQQKLNELINQYPVSNLSELKSSLDKLEKQYETQSEIIDTLSPYANFSSFLLGLASASVPGVWLTEMTFDRGEDKITLEGHSLSPELLAKFYSALAAQPVFSMIKFEVSEMTQTTYPSHFVIKGKKRM